jgi:predicted transcriptional regulator
VNRLISTLSASRPKSKSTQRGQQADIHMGSAVLFAYFPSLRYLPGGGPPSEYSTGVGQVSIRRPESVFCPGVNRLTIGGIPRCGLGARRVAKRGQTVALVRKWRSNGPWTKLGEPKVWFTSTESFAKVLSKKNRALLEVIAKGRPSSLQELAKCTGRKPSNLSRTLKTMEHYGFVRLRRGERGRIRPEVPYRSISLDLPLSA